MDSRRDFLKKAAALAAGGACPAAIQRALAIDPAPGSTFLDAEHVVILMQENRSFDHCYGSLRGVRGFNDPRAITLPNGNPVWLQSNAAGETWAPFRVDLKESRVTWMGCLPHDWADQSRARNGGKHDAWLDNKRPARQEHAHLPLTMGFHNREDLPFYYAFADAFTICDQNFCSSLTGTNPNRLHLWSGTVRPEAKVSSKAHIRNGDSDTHEGISWKTFPERLEEQGLSWRVYQNELYVPTGLSSQEEPWVGNFGDNPLEYFSHYGVRYAQRHRAYLAEQLKKAEEGVKKAEALPEGEEKEAQLAGVKKALEWFRKEVVQWTEENYAKLTAVQRELHQRAFTTNEGDPAFRELDEVTYEAAGETRTLKAPRGDLFHRFRADVQTGKLPRVSWLVAPQMFSDHPDSPWYGAWYISETLDILTSKPEVWQKTIFILCYDENDGYFDHVPPFVPPDPDRPETGAASEGLHTELEFVRAEQEARHLEAYPKASTHAGPIGLGYRVPLVIASPWSRGGYVCSQVCDHTSILRLIEKWLSHKTGKPVTEPNITPWRRAVCGDLTAAFRPAPAKGQEAVTKVERDAFLRSIAKARFKPEPSVPQPLTAAEIAAAKEPSKPTGFLPQQESGTRPACALPYELSVDGGLSPDRKSLVIRFAAGNTLFGERSSGAPFHVYAPGSHRMAESGDFATGRTWDYAVRAGDGIDGTWPLDGFLNGLAHLRAHGPNGFYREFRSTQGDPALTVSLEPLLSGGKPQPGLVLVVAPLPGLDQELTVTVEDVSYGAPAHKIVIKSAAGAGTAPNASPARQEIPLQKNRGWYDLRVTVDGYPGFARRFAGRMETGEESVTDPAMS